MAEVYRTVNGNKYAFPDEESARGFDAKVEAFRIEKAQKEERFFDAGAFFKSIIPGVITGGGIAAQGIGALLQSEDLKQKGRDLRNYSDKFSEEKMGLEPYRRYTTGAEYGQIAGGMIPTIGGSAAAIYAAIAAGAPIGLATGIGLGTRALMGTAQGAGEMSADVDRARLQGADVSSEQERNLALIQGGVVGALESLQAKRIFALANAGGIGRRAIASAAQQEADDVAKLLTMAKKPILGAGYGGRLLKEGVLEGFNEGSQQVSQNVLARGDLSGVVGPGFDPKRDLMEGVRESFTAGAVFGGALQGGQDLYVRHKINKAKKEFRPVDPRSPVIGNNIEDYVGTIQVGGEQQQGVFTGTLTEKINKRLNDTLTAASVTINNEEASPLDKLNAYREFAAQYNSGKTFGELRGKDIISANKLAQSYFEGESSPESLEIGIQARESEAPGSVDMVDVKPVEGKVGRSQIYNGINFDEMVDGKPFDGKELPVTESTPVKEDTSVNRRVSEFREMHSGNTYKKTYAELSEPESYIVDRKVDFDLNTTILPTRIREREQRQAEADKAQEQRDQKAQAAQSFAVDRDYINGNDPLLKSVLSGLGLKGRLKNSDVSVVAQLMRDRVSETTQAEKDAQLKASADQANIKLQDNLAVAEPLSRELFGKNIPLLYDSQKIVLAKRLDIKLGEIAAENSRLEEEIAAENSRLQQEASLRTDINLTTPNGDPIDVRLDRAAVKIYGKRFGELSELRQGAVRNAEERIGSVVLPAEVKEKEQLKNYGVDADTLRSVIGELRNPEITPVDEQSGYVYVDASTIQSIPLVRGMRGRAVDNAQALFGAMIERGDVIEIGGNYYLDPDTNGPMYKTKGKGKKAAAVPAATTTPPAVAAATPVAPAVPAAPVEPERGTPRPRSIPLNLDVETALRVSNEAYQQLNNLGVSDHFSTVVVNNFLDSKGNIRSDSAQFLNGVIKLASKQNNIAESEENLINTVNHEVVHGMKKSGFFSDAQWKLMTNKFTVAGELDEPTIKAYRERFKNETPARIDEILQEEAVAYAMERLYNQPAKPLSFPEKTLMQRVKALAGIGTAANNLNYTAEDLISAIRSGDIGRRAIQGKPNTLNATRKTTQAAPVAAQAPNKVPVPEAVPPTNLATDESEVPTELQGDAGPDFSFVGGAAYSSDPVEGKRIADFRKAARKMEEDGRSNEEIRLATGWFRNPYDNILRYEVSDENAKLTQAFSDLEESKFAKEQKNITLDQALDHPELFKAYPELKDIKVIKQAGFFDWNQRLQGSFNPATNTVNITPYNKNPESTLIHEIQHWIQEKEGFASGGNEDIAIKLATPKQIEKILLKTIDDKRGELKKVSERMQSFEKKIRDYISADIISTRYRNEVEELKALKTDQDKLYYVWKSDPTSSEVEKRKDSWADALMEHDKKQTQLIDKIKNDLKIDRRASFSLVYDAAKQDPSTYSYINERLAEAKLESTKIKKEISDIQSGNADSVTKAIKDNKFELYESISGEIEARNTEARLRYPESQRSLEKPYISENISPDDSIVTYGSKGKGSESMSKLTNSKKPTEEVTRSKDVEIESDDSPMYKLSDLIPDRFRNIQQQPAELFREKDTKGLYKSLKDWFEKSRLNKEVILPDWFKKSFLDKEVMLPDGTISELSSTTGNRQSWFQADSPIQQIGEIRQERTGSDKSTNPITSGLNLYRQVPRANELLHQALESGYAYYDEPTGFILIKKSTDHAVMPQIRNLASKGKINQAFDAAIAQKFVDVQNSGIDAQKMLGGVMPGTTNPITAKIAQDIVDKYSGDQDIKEFLRVYRNFNNSMISLNRYAGNITVAMEQQLKAWYYSSMYRVPLDEDNNIEAPSVAISRIINLPSLVGISGRAMEINDSFENLISNAQFMFASSLHNLASRRVLREAGDIGVANELWGTDDNGNVISSPRFAKNKGAVVHVKVKGKKVYWEISDPRLYNAIDSSGVSISSLVKLGSGFSTLYRKGVTSAPYFMYTNMLMDAWRLWSLGIYKDNFVKSIIGNVAEGVYTVVLKSKTDPAYQALLSAGLITNINTARSNVQAAREIRRRLSVEQGNAFTSLAKKAAFSTLDMFEKFSKGSEAVNRVMVYKNVYKDMIKEGESADSAKSYALYASREFPVNFDTKGNHEIIRKYVQPLLPFVTAQISGTDVFYRNAKAMYKTSDLRGANKKSPINKLQASSLEASKRALSMSIIFGSLYVMASAALGNEAWKSATPEQRNRMLFIPTPLGPVTIRVPQEIGLIALAIPNAFAEKIMGEDNGLEILKSLFSFISGIFTFDMVPQAVRPITEIQRNKNFFGAPIEDQNMKRIMSEYRYDENTSLLSKELGKYFAKASVPISPVQFDHLIHGYFGTLGTFAAELSSQLFDRSFQDKEPARTELYMMPGFKKIFPSPKDAKAMSDYYAIRNAATEAANTIKMIDAGKVFEDDPTKLREMAVLAQINQAMDDGPEKEMATLRKLKNQVLSAPREQLSPSQKTETLKKITVRMNQITRGVQHLKRYVPFSILPR